MKKFCALIILMLICTFFFSSGCYIKPKASMVQATRRFAQYTEQSEQKPSNGMIDLSEGPKTNYNADFGPQKLNFDIKIVDPY